MQYQVTISREGRTLWTGTARNHHDALMGYREILGNDALEYDEINPKWFYQLDFHFDRPEGNFRPEGMAA